MIVIRSGGPYNAVIQFIVNTELSAQELLDSAKKDLMLTYIDPDKFWVWCKMKGYLSPNEDETIDFDDDRDIRVERI